ncbi:dTDP-4-dehydrorhamnose reductase [Ramlibacter pallidus]|uniref:dTDP-4-dehydrorhamnose reductase n=1 Tax=Ramlibacter pallidus TaxID=2780087 RepID=A0ABR9RYD8_9BURK|nr:dTDP-4-dehydrorhamnose reductase [Ramlibacter pallidus]
MKILLFGCNGQVGWELQRSLAPLGEVTALGAKGAGGLHGDFRDPEALAGTVRAVRPDAVVNAAAFTDVDRAEAEPELARTVNAFAPAALARAAEDVGASMVHYSTDYVFDGSGIRPWREDDTPGPLNVYGRSKLEGEIGVREAASRHLVLRTSWVYGVHGRNFATTMLQLAAERDELLVVDDQYGAPTGADLLADVTAHALRTLHERPDRSGTYHVCAGGETSWHGYARFVVGKARQAGENLRCGVGQVRGVPATAFPAAARRPDNSRLDTARFRATFGLSLPPWQQGVARLLDQLLRPAVP